MLAFSSAEHDFPDHRHNLTVDTIGGLSATHEEVEHRIPDHEVTASYSFLLKETPSQA